MASPFDTIVAPITGSGPAPIAVLRLSGPDSWRIATSLADREEERLEPRLAHFQTFCTGDEGYLILFEPGRSYTGEQSAEMSIHGSRASIQALMEAAKANGARLAEPGEFTQRRFMNGRIDLTEAEAVRDTIEADTDAQLRLANTLREGALHRRVKAMADRLVGVLAAIEASVDFSEEIGEVDPTSLLNPIQGVREECRKLLETARVGRILREGLRIAIVGPPNAGKSSLLNRLVNQDRSIVTEIPGTTRDYVEERVDFNGYPVVLIDTAGLRETNDPVESIGVQRSHAIAANADIIWFLTDAREPVDPSAWLFERPVVWIANKIDLAPATAGFLGISCSTGEGIPALVKLAEAQFDMPLGIAIQSRHEPELRDADRELEIAQEVLEHNRPPDLAAVGIRAAINSLGKITGETADADIIARIFRDFCIGK
jgi:tRNA modification GTPase